MLTIAAESCLTKLMGNLCIASQSQQFNHCLPHEFCLSEQIAACPLRGIGYLAWIGFYSDICLNQISL